MTDVSPKEPRCAATVVAALPQRESSSILRICLIDEPSGEAGGPIYRPLDEIASVPPVGGEFEILGVQGKVLDVEDGNRGKGARIRGCLWAEPHPPQVGLWVDAIIPSVRSGYPISFFATGSEGAVDV